MHLSKNKVQIRYLTHSFSRLEAGTSVVYPTNLHCVMFTTDMEPRFSSVLRCGPCATDPEQRCEHRSAILSWNHCGRMELEDSVVSPSMTLSTPAGQFCVCYSASLELQHCHLSVRWEQWYSMNWVFTLNKTNKTFSAPPNSIYEGPEWSFSFHKMKKKKPKIQETKYTKHHPLQDLQSTLRKSVLHQWPPLLIPEPSLRKRNYLLNLPSLTSGEWNPPSAPAPTTRHPSYPLFFWSDPRVCCLKDS